MRIFVLRYLQGWEWSAGHIPRVPALISADDVLKIRHVQVLVPFIQHQSVPVEVFENWTRAVHSMFAFFDSLNNTQTSDTKLNLLALPRD